MLPRSNWLTKKHSVEACYRKRNPRRKILREIKGYQAKRYLAQDMQVFFTISLLLFAIPFTVKNILHVYFDYRNGYKSYYGGIKQLKYLHPYTNEVSAEDERMKRLCNFLHPVSIFFLAIFTIVWSIKGIRQLNY